MKRLNVILYLCFILALLSCEKTELLSPASQVTSIELEMSGLNDLGGNFWYEGWFAWQDGEVVRSKSLGIFTIDAQGHCTPNRFNIELGDLQRVQSFFVTIEEDDLPGMRLEENTSGGMDTLNGPSTYKIFSAKLVTNTAYFSLGDEFLLNFDFASAQGSYLLNAVSVEQTSPSASGIWFVNKDDQGQLIAGLDLPDLPAGWSYQGWVVINTVPVSTGMFLSSAGADQSATYYNSAQGSYPFPGEDFLTNPPDGLSFPVDLSGKDVYITLQPPIPENCPAPYSARIFTATIPPDAQRMTIYDLENQAGSLPSGRLDIQIDLFK